MTDYLKNSVSGADCVTCCDPQDPFWDLFSCFAAEKLSNSSPLNASSSSLSSLIHVCVPYIHFIFPLMFLLFITIFLSPFSIFSDLYFHLNLLFHHLYLPSMFSFPSFFLFLLSSLLVSHLSPSRGPHPGPEEPRVQRDALPSAEGGAGQDKEEAAGQRRPLHLGDGRGQVHAALLPHRLLALLREAQRRFVMVCDGLIWDLLRSDGRSSHNNQSARPRADSFPIDGVLVQCILSQHTNNHLLLNSRFLHSQK